jgi:hypothetical protein
MDLSLDDTQLQYFFEYCLTCYEGAKIFFDYISQIPPDKRLNISLSCQLQMVSEMVRNKSFHKCLKAIAFSRVLGLINNIVSRDLIVDQQIAYFSLVSTLLDIPKLQMKAIIPVDISRMPIIRDAVVLGAIKHYTSTGNINSLYSWLDSGFWPDYQWKFNSAFLDLLERDAVKPYIAPKTRLWEYETSVTTTPGEPILGVLLRIMIYRNRLDMIYTCISLRKYLISCYILADLLKDDKSTMVAYGNGANEFMESFRTLITVDINIIKVFADLYKQTDDLSYDRALYVLLILNLNDEYLIPKIGDLNVISNMKFSLQAAMYRCNI